MENYFNFKKQINEIELNKIAAQIKNGKLVLFPTETVYGIGTNGLDAEAVKRIYQIKGRNFKNPINLLVSSMEMVEMVAQDITDLEYQLMETFFPGPFTLILKKKSCVPAIVTATSNTVGVRMPNHEIARKLIAYAGVPIAAPSANISGKLSGTNLEDILADFSDKIDFMIDGGSCHLGIESTIVKVIDGIPHILRPGAVTSEQIKQISGQVIVESSNLPSHDLKHYQLGVPSILISGKNEEKTITKIKEIAKNYDFPILLTFSENQNQYHTIHVMDIGSKNNLEEISKNIFTKLRQAEKLKPDIIIIEGVEKKGLGLAIMNRLLNVCNHHCIEMES